MMISGREAYTAASQSLEQSHNTIIESMPWQ